MKLGSLLRTPSPGLSRRVRRRVIAISSSRARHQGVVSCIALETSCYRRDPRRILTELPFELLEELRPEVAGARLKVCNQTHVHRDATAFNTLGELLQGAVSLAGRVVPGVAAFRCNRRF